MDENYREMGGSKSIKQSNRRKKKTKIKNIEGAQREKRQRK